MVQQPAHSPPPTQKSLNLVEYSLLLMNIVSMQCVTQYSIVAKRTRADSRRNKFNLPGAIGISEYAPSD